MHKQNYEGDHEVLDCVAGFLADRKCLKFINLLLLQVIILVAHCAIRGVPGGHFLQALSPSPLISSSGVPSAHHGCHLFAYKLVGTMVLTILRRGRVLQVEPFLIIIVILIAYPMFVVRHFDQNNNL